MSRRRCNARSKRTGEQCGALAMRGKEKCYHRGGKSLTGTASPSFGHGLYSRQATAAFGSLFTEIRADADLGELRDDLSVFIALAREQLEGIRSGESKEAWKALQKIFTDLRGKESEGNVPGVQTCLAAMGEIIQRGVLAHHARSELADLLEKQSRVADRENRRLDSKYRSIAVDQAMVILIAIANSIRMAVEGAAIDEREKRRILTSTASAFTRFTGDDLRALPCGTDGHHEGESVGLSHQD